MIFYNYVNHGDRYKYSGKILYDYLKDNYFNLIYKDTNNINNLNFKNGDYIYYYFDCNNRPLSKYIIGRDYKANKYYNKIQQYLDFKEFFPDSIIIDSSNTIKCCVNMFKHTDKIYVTLDKGYGGIGSFISNKNDIYKIYNILEDNNITARITSYLKIIKNISVHLILFRDGYIITNKTNQYIYRNVLYRGNFYPNNLTQEENNKINIIIDKISNRLIENNILGIIGLDLMIDNTNKIYLTEINPHKMGSSVCVNMQSKLEWNIPIPVLEYYACANISVNDINLNISNKNKIKWSLLYLYNTENINKKHNIIDVDSIFYYMRDSYYNNNKHEIYFKDNYNSKDFYFRLKIENVKN